MKRRPKQPLPDEPPTRSDADAASIMQIKVWLVGISPMVWRRVLVPMNFTLRQLHGVIQVAMGDRRKFGGVRGGGVFWPLFSDLRWMRGLDREVGENRGRW
jgi:hypothetical protein